MRREKEEKEEQEEGERGGGVGREREAQRKGARERGRQGGRQGGREIRKGREEMCVVMDNLAFISACNVDSALGRPGCAGFFQGKQCAR